MSSEADTPEEAAGLLVDSDRVPQNRLVRFAFHDSGAISARLRGLPLLPAAN